MKKERMFLKYIGHLTIFFRIFHPPFTWRDLEAHNGAKQKLFFSQFLVSLIGIELSTEGADLCSCVVHSECSWIKIRK